MSDAVAVRSAAPMMILNRRPGLPERGKIKIGMKGETRKSQSGGDFQLPVKLDHFLVTTMERDASGNFMPDIELMTAIAERTGQKAAHLTRIPVRLLYDAIELNMPSRYASYNGRMLWCSGNGVEAMRHESGTMYKSRACPCEHLEMGYKDKPCKVNAALSVLIEGALGVGGAWKFRTTSFNSHSGLMGALEFIKTVTRGKLAGLPLWLTVTAKQATDPTGKQQTIYVVSLEFAGTMDDLREKAYQLALRERTAELRIENVEAEARLLLEAPCGVPLPGDDNEDVVDEFYPGEARKSGPMRETESQQGGGQEAGDAKPTAQGSATPIGDIPGIQPIGPVAVGIHDPDPPFASAEQIAKLLGLATAAAIKKACAHVGVDSPDNLYESQILAMIANIEAAKAARK